MTLSSLNLLLFLFTTWYDLIATSVLSQASLIEFECGIVATLFKAALKPFKSSSLSKLYEFITWPTCKLFISLPSAVAT